MGRLALALFVRPMLMRRQQRPPAKTVATPSPFAGFKRFFAPVALLVLFAYPFIVLQLTGIQGSIKWVDNFGVQILIYVMLGWGLNVVVGLAGLLDLGYVAFYAVGAYTYALLATHFGLSFWLLLPIAGLLAASWGVALGFPVLRLRGDYLAIVTLAFGEIIRLVLINWREVTNGGFGILSIPKVTLFGMPFDASPHGFAHTFGLPTSSAYYKIFLYYLILLLALFTAFVTTRLRRLPIGRAWELLREDEIACRSLGINTTNTKLTAFAIGAMFGGFAGSFFAARQGFVSPESFVFLEFGDGRCHRRAWWDGFDDRCRGRRGLHDRRHRNPARDGCSEVGLRTRLRPRPVPDAHLRHRHGLDHGLAPARLRKDAAADRLPEQTQSNLRRPCARGSRLTWMPANTRGRSTRS